jgi:multidrug efflux pump subunit AcrB
MSGENDHKSYEELEKKGPLAWMASNSVAANLAMVFLLVGGLLMVPFIKQEVFPEVSLDTISVQVPYPGASPAEVEQAVILAVEEAVRGIDDVKKVTATASEGSARVTIELLSGAEPEATLNDVKSAVDRITSLPQDAERPIISLNSNRRQVLSLVLYGDLEEKTLRQLAESVREDLLLQDDITVVELGGLREPEISVEVPQSELRQYGLTLEQIAGAVSRASVELPGGSVKTASGEILIRTTERRDVGSEFENIIVLSRPDGTEVTLGSIANVVDGFRDSDIEAYFNGQRAAKVEVYRVGDQTPLEISAAVRDYADQLEERLPEGVSVAVWNDSSEVYQDRINLLLKNAMIGLVLVLLALGLFLEIKLAFWVTMGIAISIVGALISMPLTNASLNMISLFAFILTLGIVVDDAIVVGEAVYKHRKDGKGPLQAAVDGAREVGTPVVFSVLTTVMAFTPLLFVPGIMGKFFIQIPLIVIPILLLSLFESLFILPAHLSHTKSGEKPGVFAWIDRQQQKFSEGMERFVANIYQPFVKWVVHYRYITLSTGIFLLILTVGLVGGGFVRFIFFPKIEGDLVSAGIQMPYGSPVDETREVADRLLDEAQAVVAENGGDAILRGVYTDVGQQTMRAGPMTSGRQGSHVGTVQVFLVPAAEREINTAEFSRKWRERVGEIAGVEKLSFNFNLGPSSGMPVDIQLSHKDPEILEAAAAELAESVKTYNGVFDVDDGYTPGKEQLDLQLKPAARALGITELGLARQVRNAFFGAEAVRQQRGRNELRVYVRRPEDERVSEHDIEELIVHTPNGGEMMLRDAAIVDRGRSYTEIVRRDGRRVLNVTADVDEEVTSGQEVVGNLESDVLPQLIADYPGLSYDLAGEQEERMESLGALRTGFLLALLAMFGLMAIAFRSYVQPLIIMFAIPFGFVGAVAGHLLMGYELSFMSAMGVVALSGVVVNDSLVLIAAINDFRKEGMEVEESVIAGGMRRFRPILLTSLTTFLGLAPMIFETSVQAKFLIPMALSLGFGILFVTYIALVLVPALYMIVEDARRKVTSVREWVSAG